MGVGYYWLVFEKLTQSKDCQETCRDQHGRCGTGSVFVDRALCGVEEALTWCKRLRGQRAEALRLYLQLQGWAPSPVAHKVLPTVGDWPCKDENFQSFFVLVLVETRDQRLMQLLFFLGLC